MSKMAEYFRRIRKRPAKHIYLRMYVAVRYPLCRLDWVAPDMAMLTSPDGERWLIRDRKPELWWSSLAMQFVPASICIGCAFLLAMLAAQFAL